MTRSGAFALAVGLVVPIVACQRQESGTAETAVAAAPASDVASSVPESTAAAAYDLQFLDSMSKHHQMAIDMAKAGHDKFMHTELKDMANKIVEDQEREIAQMKQWRDQWYSGAAPAESMQMPGMASMNMDMTHMQMAVRHTRRPGKQLDLMFIDMMIPHHQGAIEMARDAMARAEHQEIKDLAQKMITEQQKEIDQLKQWKSRWSTEK